ncbi:MAG: hypothetical protein AMXMBFR55_05580 [Gemmatimonadota bacterium]
MRRDRPAEEREARALVEAYLSGSGSLEAAVAAVQALELERRDESTEEDAEEAEPILGIDLSVLTPQQRARFSELMEALDASP